VMNHTASHWGNRFIRTLKEAATEAEKRKQQPGDLQRVLNSYSQHKKRLIILAYDGTLVPFEHIPSLARPTRKVFGLLRRLIAAGNTVFLVSGRDKQTMDEWFSSVSGLGLGAEHGFFFRPPNSQWHHLLDNVPTDWKEAVRPILKHYTDRTPGSSCEEKEVTFTWHYRYAGSANGASQACDLQIHLESNFGRWPIEVLHVNKAIEIRPNDVNATKMIKHFLESKDMSDVDLVLYVGDNLIVPQEIHKVHPESQMEVITCVVGKKHSLQQASLYLSTPDNVHSFLDKLCPATTKE